MRKSRISALLRCVVLGAAFSGLLVEVAFSQQLTSNPQAPSSPDTSPIAGPNRPANVPEGYVITPFGYFHPSCVASLAKGERFLADGRLQHADGSLAASSPACNYPRYKSSGMPLQAGTGSAATPQKNNPQATAPLINGWEEAAYIVASSASKSYGAIIATWRVPPHPPTDDGQVLYFFPGFEDIANTESILQPVLQWYQGQWALGSWNCCLNGIIVHSPFVNVAPGHEIYGSITNNCAAGALYCPSWNVLSLDMSTGENTTLGDTPSDGQIFNWAFSGVMEVYGVVSCEDYPADPHLTFDNIVLFDQYLNPVFDPKWTGGFNPTMTPQCSYYVGTNKSTTVLWY